MYYLDDLVCQIKSLNYFNFVSKEWKLAKISLFTGTLQKVKKPNENASILMHQWIICTIAAVKIFRRVLNPERFVVAKWSLRVHVQFCNIFAHTRDYCVWRLIWPRPYHTVIVNRPNEERKSKLFRNYCSRLSYCELQGPSIAQPRCADKRGDLPTQASNGTLKSREC